MRRSLSVVVTAAALLLSAGPAARAGGLDWSASFGISAGDSTYLNLSVSHFGGDRDDVYAVARKLRHPEYDLPVLLFLARESGRPLSFIVGLRMNGFSWWEIRARLGVPPDRVIVALPRDPGPPYGKAHGYYRNKHRGGDALVLTDAEFRDWVGVRVLARSFDVDPMVVVSARQRGISLAEFSLERDGGRTSGKPASSKRGGKGGPPAGKGKGKGKGGPRGKPGRN